MNKIKVSSKSNCNNVASVIANIIRQNSEIEVNTIGAGALNQTIKSIIIAKGILAPIGINIICLPSFCDIKIGDSTKTGIRMLVKNIEKI